MTVKTRAEIKAENSADLPDNTARFISPAGLRGQMDDTVDSALLREDIPGLDLSAANVTATASITKTLKLWVDDIGSGAGSGTDEFDTVAAMLASPRVTMGVGSVWRADGFRYREADPAATDHHLTTAGGVKLYVQPGDDGWYNFRAMNPAMDGVTNDADKLKTLLAIRPTGGLTPSRPYWPGGASIQIPAGAYYMDPGPWGFQIKAVTHIRGEGHAPDNNFGGTNLKFPANVVGFMFNHLDTMENWVEDFADLTGGALGSTIERLALTSISGTGSNPNAHGIWSKTTVHIRDVTVYGFFGHGIAITGSGGAHSTYWVSGTNYAFNTNVKGSNKVIYYCAVDPGGATTSVNEPTHVHGVQAYPDGYSWGIYLYGGPSMCSLTNVTSFYNHNCGVYIVGHDASVMCGIRMDVYANGRWGLYDDSFLGNTWIDVHSEGNGLGTRGGNPAGTSSCVTVDLGSNLWDHYYAVHTATEAQLVATQPGTDENIWRLYRDNLLNPAGAADPQHIIWEPGKPVGTYFVGGCFWSGGPSPRNTFIGCYAELSEAFGVLGPVSISIGGIAAWHQATGALAAGYDGIGGMMTTESGYRVEDRFGNLVIVGGDANATDDSFVALTFQSASEGLPWKLQYDNLTPGFGDWYLDYGGSQRPFNLTSVNTVNKMGTSKTQPYLMHFPVLAIGGSTTTRRQVTNSVIPTTGEWASGDITWNTTSTNRFAGWRCTSTGAFGATSWVTGTNYALNAIILSSGGKYYRCSVDPGGVITSTVEPAHASGEVIGADGYGWTWVSNSAVEFSPFGESINTYEHTSAGVGLSLSVQTHPTQIIYSATVATTAAVSISTAGAYKGARFRFTRTGPGGVVNLGTGPLRSLPENTWCEVTYNGTAWFVSAAGTIYDQASQQTLATNADFTLTPGTSPQRTRHTGTLTADRAVTLSTTGAIQGQMFRVSRSGGGAFNLNVGTGPLKALATNQWCEVVYDGTAWYLSAYGTL